MKEQKTSVAALISILVGLSAVIVLLLAGYGYQWNWWALGTAFTWMLPGSVILGLIAVGLGVVFAFSKRKDPALRGRARAWIGALLGLTVIGFVGYWFYQAQQYPPIHDISTDTVNPPTYEAVVPLRAEAPNDTSYGGADKAKIQREHYPDVQTLYLDVSYPEAFSRALETARAMDWEQIVAADKAAGRIEATDKLAWFGFKDDIVIRVDTAQTSGKRMAIDVRSVSRIGRGDIGVNAHRIREYLEVLKGM